MAKVIRTKLSSATARLALPVRPKPYFVKTVAKGVMLGYRRLEVGCGTWVVRVRRNGKEWTEAFSTAADYPNVDGLTHEQAQDKSREVSNRGKSTAVGTVGDALTKYETELSIRGKDAFNVGRVRKHLSEDLANKPLARLEANDLRDWRNELTKVMQRVSVNRTLAIMKAALYFAAKGNSALSREVIKLGLGMIPANGTDQRERDRNIVLSPAVRKALIDASYRVSREFGLFVHVLAETGTRPSQAARLQATDLQFITKVKPRLMVPVSRKGTGEKDTSHTPVPISQDLADKLMGRANGLLLPRPDGAPWITMHKGRAMGNYEKSFMRARDTVLAQIRASGVDPNAVGIYSLRHSRITEMLQAGVPVRIVASAHDTSVQQIEATYSRHIVSHSDDIIRAAMFSSEPTTTSPRLTVVQKA